MLYEGEFASIATEPGMLERTILLDGFSKTFAMTGWRCGYAAVPEALVDPLIRFFVNSTSCVPPFVQLAGVAALQGPWDDIAAMMAEFRAAARSSSRVSTRCPACPADTARSVLRLPERSRHGLRRGRARAAAARRGRRRRSLRLGLRAGRARQPAALVRQLAGEPGRARSSGSARSWRRRPTARPVTIRPLCGTAVPHYDLRMWALAQGRSRSTAPHSCSSTWSRATSRRASASSPRRPVCRSRRPRGSSARSSARVSSSATAARASGPGRCSCASPAGRLRRARRARGDTLDRLAAASGETVNLGVLDAARRRSARPARRPPLHRLDELGRAPGAAPLHRPGQGVPGLRRCGAAAAPLERHAPRTIVDPDALARRARARPRARLRDDARRARARSLGRRRARLRPLTASSSPRSASPGRRRDCTKGCWPSSANCSSTKRCPCRPDWEPPTRSEVPHDA